MNIDGNNSSEIALKALDNMARASHQAARSATSLADKLRFQALERKCNDARRSLRLSHFDFEDAMKELGVINPV